MRFIEDNKKQKAKGPKCFPQNFCVFHYGLDGPGVGVDIFRYRLAGPRVGVDPG